MNPHATLTQPHPAYILTTPLRGARFSLNQPSRTPSRPSRGADPHAPGGLYKDPRAGSGGSIHLAGDPRLVRATTVPRLEQRIFADLGAMLAAVVPSIGGW